MGGVQDGLAEKYNTAKTMLEEYGFDTFEFREINYGVQFRVKKGDWSGTVRIFASKKKGITYDLSQIKGEMADNVKSLLEHGKALPFSSAGKSPGLPEFPYIGSDESGKGDYFGPLVAAAVYVDEKDDAELKKAGVRDSKDNSDVQNIKLAKIIRQVCAGKYQIAEFPPEKYNTLYEQYRAEGKKLNSLLAAGHAAVIEGLLDKFDCGKIIIDQFAGEKVIFEEMKEKADNIKIVVTPRAESYTAVAAASILARAGYLEGMEELSSKYGVELLKGASDKVILRARDFTAKHGREKLKYVAKLHFKTTDEV